MTLLGFLSLVIGFITDTLTDLFHSLDKPASNLMVLVVLGGVYAIYQKTKNTYSQFLVLREQLAKLAWRLDKLEERARPSDEDDSTLRRKAMTKFGRAMAPTKDDR
jgi:hypothetical protein